MAASAEGIHTHIPLPTYEDTKEAGWVFGYPLHSSVEQMVDIMENWFEANQNWKYEAAVWRKSDPRITRSQLDVVMHSRAGSSERPVFYTGKWFWVTPHLNLWMVLSNQAPTTMVATYGGDWGKRFIELDGLKVKNAPCEVENIAVRPFLRRIQFPERWTKEDTTRLVVTTSLINLH